jgi:hypothetical protein
MLVAVGPEQARRSAIYLSRAPYEPSVGVQLLAALRATVFFFLAGWHAERIGRNFVPKNRQSSPPQRQRDGAVWRS